MYVAKIQENINGVRLMCKNKEIWKEIARQKEWNI